MVGWMFDSAPRAIFWSYTGIHATLLHSEGWKNAAKKGMIVKRLLRP